VTASSLRLGCSIRLGFPRSGKQKHFTTRGRAYPAVALAIFTSSAFIVLPDVINMKRPCISPSMRAFLLIGESSLNACFFIFQVYTVHRVLWRFRRDATRKRTSFYQL